MDPANKREALGKSRSTLPRRGHDHGQTRAAISRRTERRAQKIDLPLAAYQVSGEYAMLHAAAANGWLDLRRSRWKR